MDFYLIVYQLRTHYFKMKKPIQTFVAIMVKPKTREKVMKELYKRKINGEKIVVDQLINELLDK